MANLDHILPRLKSQFERGEPVLFTGAGFSVGAKSSTGQAMPSSKVLTEEFWRLAFPSTSPDPGTRLGDAFHAALSRNRNALSRLIQERLSVESESLPSYYSRWLSMPWSGYYTLNVDDLELAVVRRYGLTKSIRSISATSGRTEDSSIGVVADLLVVHLNGIVGDDVADLTFSSIDYGMRQSRPDEWMVSAMNDILTRPVVFVGTQLDEPTLWQYLEYRRRRGERGIRELRPGSVLVSPHLDRARELLLREFNIDWVQMDAQDFAHEVLDNLVSSIDQGHAALRSKRDSDQRTQYPPLVSDLMASGDAERTEYLLGHEPRWADLTSDRAIERSCDPYIFSQAKSILSGERQGRPLLLTGTAGTGKSTSLMRLAIEVSGTGVATYWLDERSNIDVNRLRELVTDNEEPVAIIVDDADIFGRLIAGWARELPKQRSKVLFACSLRSSRVDGLMDEDTLAGTKPIEITMPLLEDGDIDALIALLDRENRLGILKGANAEKRRSAFRNQAGRQLLVGMYQATSGLRFSEKVVEEYMELEEITRFLYGVICMIHSQRYSLNLDEVLTAVNSSSNETLNVLEQLVARGLVTRDDKYSGYNARHRVVAEQVVNSQVFRSEVRTIIGGLMVALAINLKSTESRNSRRWRRFTRFLNHEFLLNFLVLEDARQVYGSIESVMEWDYHFWLQRGSLEIQEGDLEFATNYLGQAKSLAPTDRLVRAGWSYLLMKKAARMPSHTEARAWFSEGYEILISLVEDRGYSDPHPYHILGSQTIAWVHSASLSTLEERSLLRRALEVVEAGRKLNFKNVELRQLSDDLKKELLMTAVSA